MSINQEITCIIGLVWKACMRQKRIGGSNPPHSARREHWMRTQGFVIGLPLSLKESPSLRILLEFYSNF